MLKNYFKIAFRNLLKNKTFSFLNITGLAIGMASAMLILLWVHKEFSYDSFYKKSDRLYQTWNRDKGENGINCWNVTPKPLAAGLKKEFPEIEKASRFFWEEAFLFSVGEKRMNVTGNMVDPDFLTMFEFPFIKGDMNTALNNPTDIVITQKLSEKLFGNEDAMDKTIKVDNRYLFTVSAVMENLPGNTQFNFEYLLPWSHMKTTNQDDSSWNSNSTRNYVLLKPNTNITAVNAKIKNIIINHTEPGTTVESFLYPVSKLRLYSTFENGKPSGGKIEMVRVFIIIAVFILLIACINFMNMSTARSEKRAKEVGIRKVAGAQKKSLIAQFLGESILMSLIAGVLAFFIVLLSLPAFNNVISKELVIFTQVVKPLQIEYGNVYFWLFFVGFILFTGIVAGSYPAFFLSSFKPVTVLKGNFKKVQALISPRKVLVVSQFTFAVILIVCTIIIRQQIQHAQDRQVGYDKKNLVFVPFMGDVIKNYTLIKNELLQKNIAVAVSKTSAPITEGWGSGGAEWEGKNPNDETEFNYYNSDGSLVKATGMQLISGRDIDLNNYPTDSSAVLISEAAVKAMGFKNPIGQVINKEDNGGWHVIGVIKDFILQSPYEPIKPMIIQGPKAIWFNVVHIKFSSAASTAESITAMQKVFRQYNPNYPFEYTFVDEKYAQKFNDEQTTSTLATIFAVLTIFISCLGLFGLAAYMAANRIKEIGVRKILGASVAGIAVLLSKDFIRLVVIAIVIASPVAWWLMYEWLSSYHYRIGISWWIFIAAGGMAVLIALVTVSSQAIKAAVANPVKSLRTE